MRLVLTREHSSDQGTSGKLTKDGKLVCLTLELPWEDNARGESCIPAGVYQVDYMARSASGKYRDVYHVTNVPDRTGILIHPANFAGDTEQGWQSQLLGCIAPCRSIGMLVNENGVKQLAGILSRPALGDLHKAVGRQSFELEIVWTP